MQKRLSRIATADREVSFAQAASWTGLLDGGTRARGTKTSCPFCFDGGGTDPAFRIYEDHGFCFAENRFYSTTRLLAAFWQVSMEDAADKALKQIGWRPPTVENLWKEASADPPPAIGALETALRTYCGTLPGWKDLQYTSSVGGMLATCLALLPTIKSEAECVEWLSRCKAIMAVAIGGSSG
jgi:hypothetical protein